MRIYRLTCSVCGNRADFHSKFAATQSMRHHTPEICAKQLAAVKKYRSLSWDDKAWVVLLTVRGDVFDHLLRDIGRGGITKRNLRPTKGET